MASLTQLNMTKDELKKHHKDMKDKMGRWRTTSLFIETRRQELADEQYLSIFTTKDHNHKFKGKEYASLKQIYMSYEHVPGFEYEFAMDVFGSWDCWENLMKSGTIRPYIEAWRREYEVMLRCNAMKEIVKASKSQDPRGLQAAKYLTDGLYKEGKKAGRPSKEEVERERKVAAGVRDTLAADMERLGLAVVNGGK